MNAPRMISFVVLITAVVGGIMYLNSQKAPRDTIGGKVDVKPGMGKEEKAKLYPVAKEITTPDGFINTDGKPITVGEFIGKKVVLLDIWTYSCINCQRTTPYLNAWYEKYKDKGFVIIGLHTPEFEFEKVYQNVLEAVKRLGIKYPVVLDNDYSTWNAYQNRFWPRKYLIDIDGYIVYDHTGEGAYEETERKIQELLEERETAFGMNEEISKDISTPIGIVGVDSVKSRSPEIYFGAARNQYLANGNSGVVGLQHLEKLSKIELNKLYLVGDWDIQNEYAENKNAGAKIIFRYSARDVHLVGGASGGVDIHIYKDGQLLDNRGGAPINGQERIEEEDLYNLVCCGEYGEHTLEIIIENPGLRAFTFTFG